jgi:uncharacterized protein (TIGR02246 family)
MPTIAEDRDAIRDLFARYCLYVDTGDADGYADAFTDDGQMVIPAMEVAVSGRDALWHFGTTFRATMHHMVVNEVIDVDGDTAHARSSILVITDGAVSLSGRYTDELRRVDGAWKIARRELATDGA